MAWLQRELVDAGAALGWLYGESALPEASADTARGLLGRLANAPRSWTFAQPAAGAAPWRAAFAQLLSDPDAQIHV